MSQNEKEGQYSGVTQTLSGIRLNALCHGHCDFGQESNYTVRAYVQVKFYLLH